CDRLPDGSTRLRPRRGPPPPTPPLPPPASARATKSCCRRSPTTGRYHVERLAPRAGLPGAIFLPHRPQRHPARLELDRFLQATQRVAVRVELLQPILEVKEARL